MNFLEIILLFFAFQALLYAFFLIVKKSRVKTANVLWALFLSMFAYSIFYSVLYWSNFVEGLALKLSFLFFIPVSLYGPLFYLYVKELTKGQGLSGKDMLHFIPLMLVLLNFGKYYLMSGESKRMLLETNTLPSVFLIPSGIIYWGLTACILAYAVAAYVEYRKYYRDDNEMRLWLKLITAAFAGFAISWLCFLILLVSGSLNADQDYMISIMMAFFVVLTTYFGFNYTEVFNGKALSKIFPLIKYEKSGLSKGVLLDLKDKLLDQVETNALYLDTELKLTDLAAALNISRHHTSQIINECFNMSFYEFINKYRVGEAERLLASGKNSDLNISDIAYMAGFNNRISFYNAFNKYVGVTPSEYRDRNMAS